MTTRNHFVHYIKRRVVVRYPKRADDPWFAELQAYDQGLGKPVYHVTRSKAWPVPSVKKGDVIWLVGQLYSPWGKLPPSIDARIEVAAVEKTPTIKGRNKTRFLAGPASKWLPLADASALFAELKVTAKGGRVTWPYKYRCGRDLLRLCRDHSFRPETDTLL